MGTEIVPDGQPFHRRRFLVALAAVRDLFICAKHLFAAARTVQRGQGGYHGAKVIGSAWAGLAIT
jgi:hypothetical protein